MKLTVEVFFEPRDLWIGVYWNRTHSFMDDVRWLDVYICIIPTLPIHLKFRMESDTHE